MGHIKFINKKFEQIFNLKSKAYCGLNLDQLIAKTPEILALKSFTALKENFSQTQNFIINNPPHHYRLLASAVLEGGAKFSGFIITLVQITRERELELAQQQNERLLAQNAKMALVGEMINSISHQQRQPLSAVLLALDEISECLEQGRESEIYAHISRAKQATRLMDETIQAFRDFYRQDDVPSKFSLSDLIEQVLFIAKAQINTSGIELKFSCKKGEFRVFSVASYIKQIVLVLLANAKDELEAQVKKGALKEPKIWLNLDKIADEICISVSDNGGGVHDAGLVFEPFFTSKAQGTGMGLYVARELANKLGARLELINAANPTKFGLFFGGKEGRCMPK